MEIDPALFEENERTAPNQDQRLYLQAGELNCEAGGYLSEVTIAYETWGELSAAKDNAILVCHALSGDAHAVGWWERMVGPGKPIDTNKFFVIGANSLGGCQGTTGPTSLAPDGEPYRTRFPMITVADMVELHRRLVESLGIETLYGAAGGSMGGMQALELARRWRVKKVFMTASCAAHSAMQIAFTEVGRQAIMRDPDWNGGYYTEQPKGGMAVARMMGHLGYLSEASFHHKFGRRLQDREKFAYTFDPEFQVESYLRHQGEKFVTRFDANSYLYFSRALNYYACESLIGVPTEFLFISFKSDWLYPTHLSAELLQLAQQAGCNAQHFDVDLPYGHDAFLLDGEHQGAYVREFFKQ